MRDCFKKMSKGLLGILLLAGTVSTSAQESKGNFNIGADVVSSYVWRGVNQGSNQPNIQPTVSYSYNKLTIGAWGSGNFAGSLKEFDLYATYALTDLFSITVTDYNWIFSKSYFDYANDKTDHLYEGSLAYAGVESFPLSASVNTMFYGADKKSDGKNAYSTYLELGYPVCTNAKLSVGASMFDSPGVYANTGFSLTNISLKVTKEIPLSDKFSLPIYGIAGFNPNAESAFLVAGITL